MQVQKLVATDKFSKSFLRTWLPIALILTTAAALRLYQLEAESFWIDEFYSLRAAENIQFNFRFLYFVLLRVWMLFGTSDAWLRGLSVIFGIGVVFLTYQLGYHLVGKLTGLVAAFSIAVSPLFIFHSQEVRMYMVSVFFSLAGTLALLETLEKPTISHYGYWLLLRFLAIFTTPINALTLLADFVIIFLKLRDQRIIIKLFAVMLGLGFIFSPGVIAFINASVRFVEVRTGAPTLSAVLLRQLPIAMVTGPFRDISSYEKWLYYVIFNLVLGFLFIFLILNKNRSSRLNWLALWGFIPLVLILICSYTLFKIWVPRYLLISTPYVIILLSASFVQVLKWKRFVAVTLALVYAVALTAGLLNYYTKLNKTNWRGAVQMISSSEQPGDVIVTVTDFTRDYIFGHYYDGTSPIYSLAKEAEIKQSGYDQPSLDKEVSQLPLNSRTWLFYYVPHGKTPLLLSSFEKHFAIEQQWSFKGYLKEFEVFLLTPNLPAHEVLLE